MRKYQIPQTRLPFVNAEIAEVIFNGRPHLVSSTYSHTYGGRIYIFDPETGESTYRLLPDNIDGAYMLRTAPDGRLYLGCCEGSLIVYDPQFDQFEILVRGEMSGITWGGCIAGSLVAWSASPGDACIYHWKERKLLKVFRPLDAENPPSLYAHNVLACPDGKILFGLNCPQARLVILDPASMQVQSHSPEVLKGRIYTQWLAFLDNERLLVISGNELFILRYPSLETIRIITPPEEIERDQHITRRACCLIGTKVYCLFWPGGNLYRLDFDQDESKWQIVQSPFVGDSPSVLHGYDNRYVCALDTAGRFLRYDARDGEIIEHQLDAYGQMETHCLCVVPQIGKAFGGPYINQRFWEIDLETSNGRDLARAAPGGGQICCMVWDEATARLIMASYTTCTVTAFDPDAPAAWPDNPRVLTVIGHEQMRPMDMVHDGRYIWLASSPQYGHLGGALSRIDPKSGEVCLWRHLIPDEKPNSLVLDKSSRLLYIGMEIYADGNSTPATQKTAKLVAFDIDNLEIRYQQSIRDDATALRVLAMLPSGKVLILDGTEGFTWHIRRGTLWAWSPHDGTIERLGQVTENLGDVATGPDGHIYAAYGNKICQVVLNGSNISFQTIIETGDWPGEFLQVHDGVLYFVVAEELRAIPLE